MSSGKVKCTCGWSWNKSDSSKKDMYVCHKCGNANAKDSMKNGGWLDSISQAQDGINSPNVRAQEQYFEERNKEAEEYEKFLGNTGEELIDFGQRFVQRLKFLPGIGSTLAVVEAEANNQDAALSDELGMLPFWPAQAASLMALYAEKENENFQKFAENRDRGKDLSQLAPEEDINNRVIDNTYVPKPKIVELKETKSKKIPYKEKKETNKVEIDNTRTVKPQVNTNYKPESKPEIKYKFNIPSITYSDNSFVMPREVNDTEIDNTYVAKPRLKNGGWLDAYNEEVPQAQNGIEGTMAGLTDKGFNYNGAWGGQFKEGGEIPMAQNGKKKPLYVESKNDPRYKAYQDSLSAYNTSIQDKNETLDFIKRQLIKDNNNRGILDKTFNDKLTAVKKDLDYSVQTYPGGIKPIKSYVYERSDGKTQLGAYDVLKKPQQEVIVKPTVTITTTKKPKPDKTRDKLTPIQNNLQPEGLVQSDTELNADVSGLRPQARIPKYFNVTDRVNQNFGGSETSYKYYPENGPLQELAPEPYNTRTMVPQYQTGGKTFLQPTSDKLPEGYRIPFSDPSSELAMSIGGEGGEPAYLIPSFKYGRPLADPMLEFRNTGEHLGGPFKTYQEADEWERTVRHPAVENRETIMFPQEKFQTGGSMPGSVGFTYARTKGIPSEGPYAKKTLPSAQNGQEMKFYQEGLDWKPKTISRNGAWLDGYEKAQDGKKKFKLKDERGEVFKTSESTNVKKKDFDLEQSKANKAYNNAVVAQKKEAARRKKLTQDQREREDYNAYNQERGEIKEYVPETNWERTKAIVSNPMTAIGYKTRGENLPGRFQFGPRNEHDYAVDWINPLQGAVALSEIPGELGRGEFLEAGLSGLDALDLGVYARGAKKALEPVVNKGVQQLGNIKTSIAPELREGLQSNGFLDMFKSKPKSEINWGKWNSEIPKNSQLMKEYNAIEQTSKANGSWMKNPDGSPFQGTPEQFVQQNSENFKKAFPNVLRDEANNIQKTYHGSQNTFDFFNPNIMMTGRTRGQGIYTSPFKERAASYATKGDKKIYELYQNANKPQDIVGQFNKASDQRFKDFLEKNPKGSKNFDKKFDEFMKKEDELYSLTDKDFNLQQGYDFFKASPDEYVVPFTNYPKSAVGNNGMFDMTNPNIYKSIVPIAGASYLATQGQEEPLPGMRQGGIIKDDRGQWAHPGEITEIGSNDITMEGVPYPVLGISDTGDTKLMQPGGKYKYKGKKVTEFPMAKNGVNQADENSLVKLDQLTNWTNYNTKQKGGWLDNL